MTTTPSKQTQEAEAAARAASGTAIPPNETNNALDVVGDGAPQDPGRGAAAPAPAPTAQPETPPAPQPKVGSFGDERRSAIQARFREERSTTAAEQKDEVTDFTRSGGMPEEFRQFEQGAAQQPAEPGAQPQPAAEPQPAAAPAAPQPQMVEITVRGEKKFVPIEDALAKAQIAYAAEDTLDTAKAKLREIETLEQSVRDRLLRGEPAGQHQAGQAAQTAEPLPPGTDPNTTDDPFQKTVEAIQFGDPAEAKTLLRNTIARETEAATQRALAQRSIESDRLAAQRTLAEFGEKHADIANDPMARAAIEANVLAQQVEDLKAVSVDLGKIRNDGRPATPADIANFHQILRSQGHNVRSAAQLLDAAHGKYLEWRGTPKTEPAADPAPAPQPQQQQRQAPKVQISVERSTRQAAPQPQPPAPRPAPQPQPQAPLDRSAVVRAMQERSATKRGRTLGISA
jgi:hypothetical protein